MTSSILIVDDDPGAIHVLARMLGDMAEILVATTGNEALEVARRCQPDLILLDANMPDLSGFEVCSIFKNEAALADIPIIFVTAQSMPEFEVSGFERGAADFIAKPVMPPLVRARVKTQLRLKQATDELRRQAGEDALTGVASRRSFDAALRRELALARRNRQPLALLLVDVDHFKLYNDHYGHPQGDAALRAVAMALTGAARRPADLVARIGGEEFALLLPQNTLEDSATVTRRVLDGVTRLALPHRGVSADARVSVSIGASAYPAGAECEAPDSELVEARDCSQLASLLLATADKALYAAKTRGRNRACALGFAATLESPAQPIDFAATETCTQTQPTH